MLLESEKIMGFRQGAYARIWSVEEGAGKYAIANMSVSRKNPDTEEYKTEWQDGFVRLVGKAYEDIGNIDIPEGGISVKISSCDVTNNYDTNKKKLYTNYVVFGFEYPIENNKDGGEKSAAPKKTTKKTTKSKTTKAKAEAVDDGEELPF